MAIAFRVSAVVLVGLSVSFAAGCGAIKNKILGDHGDAAADASAVGPGDASALATEPPPALGATGASNEDDVARFPDEISLGNVAATLQRGADAREVPSIGRVVAKLTKGTLVTQISQRDNKYFLVTFASPKAPGTTLMGWVHADAFAGHAGADAGASKPLTCTAPMVAIYTDAPVCAKVCAKDADCNANEKCNGTGQRLKDGKPAESVTFCSMVVQKDAGAPAPATTQDAGAKPTTAADAGAKAAPAAADAGAKPTESADSDVVAPSGGKCAVGFLLVKKDNKCHRLCPTFGECKQKETRSCVSGAACGEGNKVCSADRSICK